MFRELGCKPDSGGMFCSGRFPAAVVPGGRVGLGQETAWKSLNKGLSHSRDNPGEGEAGPRLPAPLRGQQWDPRGGGGMEGGSGYGRAETKQVEVLGVHVGRVGGR